MTSLYPAIEPVETGFLEVGGGHRVYYEWSGNADGKPAVFLHGGPGGGTTATMRRFFDPGRYRIVMFDQRGCGRSTPHAGLEHNTTWDLVRDMEILREHLGIDRWQVFGGSWGSTLALAYAQAHPERVTELVLRGIFTVRSLEFDWLYRHGTNQIFPEAWEALLEPVPKHERNDILSAYHRLLHSDDEATRLAAAKAWSIFEGSTSQLVPTRDVIDAFGADHMAVSLAQIEVHYFVNNCFMEDGQLLDNMERIADIPGVIVHGRYDVLCPARNATDLAERWPGVDLRITPDAGHSAFEPGNVHELVRATDRFATNDN
ncbi:MAG: prolyl aminopeptidase [Woeseiaceae bacterium]|nr:prolyl aminopeptidase [Woeseiaceae bacterium]